MNGFETEYPYIEKIKRYNEEKLGKTGRKPLYMTKTFGCQQNEADSEKIAGILSSMGYCPTDSAEDADIIVMNTCAVRDHAEQRVLGHIGSLAGMKRENPDKIICICGCMMQRAEVRKLISEKYRHVDIVFGTFALERLPENICKVLFDKEKVTDCVESLEPIAEGIPIKRENKLKAWVSVMYGCNNFCSYCIVPYVRGRERSRDPLNVIAEVRGLVNEGYKDITLLGQNVNSFCKGSDDWNFARLLREINEIEGDFRIRFMTSHPKDATDELIDTIASCDKISKHIHLPFQSGSDRILSLMNRKYTRNDYISLTERIKNKIPSVVLTSDIIVGFPTETEEDFENTLSLAKEVGFAGLFTFIYSVRPGTPAAKMEQIDEKIKHERFEKLMALHNDLSLSHNGKYVGKTERVLCDGKTEDGIYTGRTDGNIIVNFTSDEDKVGKFADVYIENAKNWALFGEEKKGK